MQRYDREREPRHLRQRDVERAYAPRSDYRYDERDEMTGAGYGEPDDWRESYADQYEGYRSDFAQQRYGRGSNVRFGSPDYEGARGGPRGNYGAGRASAYGQGYEGSRSPYGENPRGWQDEPQRQGYAGPRPGYGRNASGAPERDYGRDFAPTGMRQGYRQYGYGQGFRGEGEEGLRDYDDSGQGYVGAYGSDLGYGDLGRGSQYGYGHRSLQGRGGGYIGEREDAYGRTVGRSYGQGYEQSQGYAQEQGYAQNLRGRGPKNYMRSDERIREDINERLTDDPLIDASEINVEVKNGVVTLTGSVDARQLKHRAEDLADHCGGVKDVDNRLAIRNAGTGQNLSGAPGGGSLSAGSRSGTAMSDELLKKH